jgi:acid phosphatase
MDRCDRRAVLQGATALWLSAAAPVLAQDRRPLSFLAVGDWGRQGARDQRAVAAAMGAAAADLQSRFVISVGDNFYPGGVQSVSDPNWRRSFEDVYTAASLQTPWYAALGNHDYRGSPNAQIAYSAVSRRWKMPARYYRITDPVLTPELDVFVLDTTPLIEDLGETVMRLSWGRVSMPSPHPQLAWLDQQLARSTARWKIVIGHHPIRSGGRHGGSAQLAQALEPMLKRYGVQAYVCGHDHVLQHVDAGGVNHICSGAGASAGEVAAVDGTRFAAARPGFAVFTLDAGALQVGFRGADGRTLYQAALARRAA